MDAIRDIGRVEIDRELRQRWRTGEPSANWARRYPGLFDDDDRRRV